uniref:Uncharacterized protein n=1 Tax=Octopus bimaculoides TaxID=37653 RepID=A0A0L8I1S5_OCTBM
MENCSKLITVVECISRMSLGVICQSDVARRRRKKRRRGRRQTLHTQLHIHYTFAYIWLPIKSSDDYLLNHSFVNSLITANPNPQYAA